jgi:cell division protease FtsH
LAGLLIAGLLFWLFTGLQGDNRIEYAEFVERVEAGNVETVTFTGQAINGEMAGEDGKSFVSTLPPQGVIGEQGITQLLRDNDVRIDARQESEGFLSLILIWLVPLLLFGGLIYYMNRQAKGQMGGLSQIGKSQGKVHKPYEPSTRFEDVAGYSEVKQEIEEIVAFLKEPDRYRKAGAEVPKGMLMVGPPGTGKTLLARAVAGEAGVPFISVAGSDFMEMFVGVGASRVRDLFKTARANAPSIIFIDELDSIGRKRGAGLGGGHDEREQTLNQLLGEIDGFSGSEGVVIMAATNRPDVLDPALQRPGLFDRQVVIPLPTLEERMEILQVHAKGKPIGDDVDLEVLARGTPGMSGADLGNLINEAALLAVREGSDVTRMRDIEGARERQTIGRERASLRLDEEEKRTVAYHEGGHALAAFLEEEADPVYKVTCLPVGMALGVTTQLPIDERHIYLRSYLDAKLRVMLGGRAAEMVVFGQPTTGGQHDLVQATNLTRAIVREYGMTDAVGPVGYGEQQQVFLGEALAKGQEYSERTAEMIDEQVRHILTKALETVVNHFTELRRGLDSMAGLLVEKESLTGEEALEAVRSAITEDQRKLLRGDAITQMPGAVEAQLNEDGEGPTGDEGPAGGDGQAPGDARGGDDGQSGGDGQAGSQDPDRCRAGAR